MEKVVDMEGPEQQKNTDLGVVLAVVGVTEAVTVPVVVLVELQGRGMEAAGVLVTALEEGKGVCEIVV